MQTVGEARSQAIQDETNLKVSEHLPELVVVLKEISEQLEEQTGQYARIATAIEILAGKGYSEFLAK